MTLQYLLDTNIVSDLINNPDGRITQRLAELGPGAVVTSVIVRSEIWYGARRRQSPRLSKQIADVLGGLEALPFDAPADEIYGLIRAELALAGTPIGGNDMFIAAHALALDLTLVTDNVDEFSRVNGLRIENWLRP